ncbi:hypothetical protein [Chryseobacterium daecheongense]|uniref:WYL domain-containing protein n=1 Tax=Chryseobacterium daecheongense TaxID=192389 RepID=A0A3N0W4Q3_9FLAO|nr:hypothetical protein [Chryseobacterium daecheongense]ROI00057.1 hypothetical protein EGI05_03980 [Chryseobacterium daecheongense]TDX95003.1 hypothetical protein BCF50_0776 [Chryseobacterium daecheongense]
MSSFNIGDFVCLQNHPYLSTNHKIKIAANADMTPPIMIVGEILNKDEYNTSTGKQSEIQLRCYYYSTKEGKYIDKWIKAEQLKKLDVSETYLKIDEFNKIDDFDLEYLKNLYLNKMVCLKSVDFELNKKKIFIDSSDGIRTNKENNHLEFLPPVMTIIDIVKNKEEKRFSSTKSDSIEKDLSKYIFKCKWYNPKTSSYSEEFIPSKILGFIVNQTEFIEMIMAGIAENNFLIASLKGKHILELEDSSNKVINNIIKPIEIIFNHYYYKINAFDYAKQKTSSYTIDNLYSLDFIEKSTIFAPTYPRYKTTFYPITENTFHEQEYYFIKYRDKFNKITNRTIKVLYKEPYIDPESNEDSFFIVANCLLRNGHIRHFKLSQILESTEIINGVKMLEEIEVEDIL